MLFNIYAGLGGGFGGADYIGTIDVETLRDAELYAYNEAVDIYGSYEGMHGLLDPHDVYDNPEDYGLTEDEVDDEVIDMLWHDDCENWIDYWAIAKKEDEGIEEEDIEML